MFRASIRQSEEMETKIELVENPERFRVIGMHT